MTDFLSRLLPEASVSSPAHLVRHMQHAAKFFVSTSARALAASVCIFGFGLVLISRTPLTLFVLHFDLVLSACLPSAGRPAVTGRLQMLLCLCPAPLPR